MLIRSPIPSTRFGPLGALASAASPATMVVTMVAME